MMTRPPVGMRVAWMIIRRLLDAVLLGLGVILLSFMIVYYHEYGDYTKPTCIIIAILVYFALSCSVIFNYNVKEWNAFVDEGVFSGPKATPTSWWRRKSK